MNALARQLRYCRKDLHVWNGRKAVFGVRYLEIPVNDIDRAIDFYEFVFGIKLERDLVDGYPMAHFPPLGDGRGADVTLAKGDVYVPSKSGAIVYFHVPDIDVVMSRATGRGSSVLYAKREVSLGTWVAEFEDSEGNRVAVSQQSK
jgi:predicted enzyme related to lactoylglutathione lyase